MSDYSFILNILKQLIDIALTPDINKQTDQCSEMLLLINAERYKTGLQPLIINHMLSKLASLKSQDMAEKHYFSHLSPTYGSSFNLLRSHGIHYIFAGENLAIDKCVDTAHTALMNSETHKRNILNPNFTEVGIGVHAKSNNSYIYTQLFIGK